LGIYSWYGINHTVAVRFIIYIVMRRILPIVAISLLVSGCAGAGISSVLTIMSGADVVSQVTTGKGAIDNVVSAGMQQDCAVFRMFKGNKVCRDHDIELLIDMGCKTYSWDDDNMPYCRDI